VLRMLEQQNLPVCFPVKSRDLRVQLIEIYFNNKKSKQSN